MAAASRVVLVRSTRVVLCRAVGSTTGPCRFRSSVTPPFSAHAINWAALPRARSENTGLFLLVAAVAMAPDNSNKLLLAAGVLLVLITGSAGAWKLPLDLDEELPLIHMLRPREASGEHLGRRARVPCDSWRLGVETNNLRDWRTIPEYCERYVGNYMMGGQYRRDSRAVIDEAVAYAESLNLTGTGKEWVFDVDETTLSNLPCYAKHGFG
jgi:hypothetical protein